MHILDGKFVDMGDIIFNILKEGIHAPIQVDRSCS